jgi:hypothetical protein
MTPAFRSDGWTHIRSFFNSEELDRAESAIRILFTQQAAKMRVEGRFTDILEALEHRDPAALYEIQKMLPGSVHVRALFDSRFIIACANLLGRDPDRLLIHGPALFVSRPRTQRLLYKWHSEAHYYPKRRTFLNLWFPLFGDRTVENGAMEVLPGSHERDFPFAEYQGFSERSAKNHFIQYEIPQQFLTDFPVRACVSARGDLIAFDRSLVHRSVENTSDQFAFAMVARVWDPADDLSLSGNIAATPYGGDYGCPGMNVRPASAQNHEGDR